MMRWKIILFICLASQIHTTAQQPAPVKVHPLIDELWAMQDTLSCMLVMREQSKFITLPKTLPKATKATRMYQGLSGLATTSQKRLLDSLDSWSISYRSFYIVNAIQARLDSTAVQKLRNDPDLSSILPDFPLITPPELTTPGNIRSKDTLLNWGIAHIRADSVWKMGITGKGVVVAGLDTGIEWDHQFLKKNYRGNQNSGPADHNYNWYDGVRQINLLPADEANESTNSPCGLSSSVPCDDHGHGTYTMGLMTGVYENQHTGIAPGTQWIGCRVMDRGMGYLSSYLIGLEWCLAPTDLMGQSPQPARAPDIINNSWACPRKEGCIPANYWLLDSAASRLSQSGIFVVASAGNTGREGCFSLTDPLAIFSSVFTVGATDKKDSITDFSSRGPIDSTFLIKPEVVAPGQEITSIYPKGKFQKSSGTSISAPITAGVAALILEANPDLRGRPDLLRKIIIETAIPILDNACGESTHPNSVYGYGRIDALYAVQLARQFHPTSSSNNKLPDFSFCVYPNPVRDFLHIVNRTDLPAHAQIYSAQGQRIKEFTLNGKESREIVVSKLPPGFYFARLTTKKGLTTLKILKI